MALRSAVSAVALCQQIACGSQLHGHWLLFASLARSMPHLITMDRQTLQSLHPVLLLSQIGFLMPTRTAAAPPSQTCCTAYGS